MRKRRIFAAVLAVFLLVQSLGTSAYATGATTTFEETVVETSEEVTESESELEGSTEAVSEDGFEESTEEVSTESMEEKSEELAEETTEVVTATETTETAVEEECEATTETSTTEDNSAEASISFNEVTIEGNNEIGNLFVEDIEAAQAENVEESQREYAVSYVEVEGKSANVLYHVIEDSTILVGVYDEATGKPCVYGTAQAKAGETTATITFDIEDMPEYYVVKAYIVNKVNRPLSEEFVCDRYTQVMQEFLAKTTADFEEEMVINFDEDTTTNFAVIKEGNERIVQGADVNLFLSYDENTGTYVFENADDTLTALETGDVFFYEFAEDDFTIIKVGQITVEGTTVTIVESDDTLEMEDAFDYVKIEEQQDNSDYEITQEDCCEGVTYEGVIQGSIFDDGTNTETATYTRGQFETLEKDITLPELSDNYEFTLEVKDEVNVTISLGFTVTAHVYFESKKVWNVDVVFDSTTGISGDISVDAEKSWPLLRHLDPIKEDILTIALSPEIYVKGEINATIGLEVHEYSTFFMSLQEISLDGSSELTNFSLQVGAEAEVGVRWAPEIKVMETKNFILFKFQGEIKGYLNATLTERVGYEAGHPCPICVSGGMKVGLSLFCEAVAFQEGPEDEWNKFERNIDLISHEFGDFYCSSKGSWGWGSCPYITADKTIYVVDSSNIPVNGAEVYIDDSSRGITNEKGILKLTLSPGNKYFLVKHTDENGNTRIGTKETEVDDNKTRITIRLDNTDKLPDNKFAKAITFSERTNLNAWWQGIGAIITKDEHLYMWGENENKHIFSSEEADVSQPVKVDVFGMKVKQIAMDKNASTNSTTIAALAENGILYMWGNNASGQLGQGSSGGMQSIPLPTAPVGVVKFVVSDSSVATITENGNLYVWGQNNSGHLGVQNGVEDGVAQQIFTDKKVRDVKLSGSNMAVLTSDSKLYILGSDWGGMLGDGDGTSENADDYASVSPVLTNIKSIEMSNNRVAAITADDDLYMWGQNYDGQIGDGTTEDKYAPVKVLSNVKSVNLDCDTFTAAITKNGEVYMWGSNHTGQLGTGGTVDALTPKKVTGVDNVIQIQTSYASSSSSEAGTVCVTEDGKIWYWGTVAPLRSYNVLTPQSFQLKNVAEVALERRSYGRLGEIYARTKEGIVWEIKDGVFTPFPILDSEVNKSGTATANAATQQEKTASYTDLVADELYNLYVVKSKDEVDILHNDNLLYAGQGRAGSDGSLSITYLMKEDYDNPKLVLLGQKEYDIANAEVTVEPLIYNGNEQYVNPVVTYEGKTLTAGVDYELSGDYAVTQIGTYTVDIIGTGLYGGTKSITYQVEPRKYTVVFDSDGGSFVESQSVIEGECVIKPEDPVKDGHTFVGWYLDDAPYDFATPVTDGITLTAVWSELEALDVTVTANISTDSLVKAGTKIILSCEDEEATIYYTTDGTEPTGDSLQYKSPIVLSENTTIKAFAIKEGYSKSQTVTFTYTISKNYGDVLPEDVPEDGMIPEGIWVAGIKDTVYTGSNLKQSFRVYDNTTMLQEKKDYTVTYKNTQKAYTYLDEDYASFEEVLKLTGKKTKIGTFDPKKAPQIVIKTKGNYKGSHTIYFKNEPADISQEGFEVADLTVTYSGKKQTPAPTLTWNGKKLKYGTDFYVPQYDAEKQNKSAYTSAGTYELKVVGKGNFKGEQVIKLIISDNKNQIAFSKVSIKGIKNAEWTGEQIIQTGYTVSYKKDPLIVEGGEYTVTWGLNMDVGNGTVTFTGTGVDTDGDGYSYIGSKTVTFKITGTNMSKVTVAGIEKSYVYTGSAVTPSGVLTYQASKNAIPVELVLDTHYTVDYQKNTDKGTATIIFTGKASGGFTGTKKHTFKISQKGIQDIVKNGSVIEQATVFYCDTANVVDGVYLASYMKGGAKPEITVTCAGLELVQGKDYTVSYANNKKVANYMNDKAPAIIIQGKGNYSGTKKVYFSIKEKALTEENGLSLVAKDKVVSTKKNGYKQSFKVYDADGKVLGTSDYDAKNAVYTLIEVTGEDGTKSTVNENLNADSIVPANSVIRISVQGKGNYANGELTGTYRIIEKNHDISKATIQIKDQEYTGKEILITSQDQFKTGKVYMKVGNEKKELILGEDIEVVSGSYVKNINKGTAKVTLRGINDFGGTKTVSFKIGARSMEDFWNGLYSKLAELFE